MDFPSEFIPYPWSTLHPVLSICSLFPRNWPDYLSTLLLVWAPVITKSQFMLVIAYPSSVFPQHCIHFLMHTLLPHNEAVPWHCTFLLTDPEASKTSKPYPRTDVSLPLSSPLYDGPIPISFINQPVSASLLTFSFPCIHTCSFWLEEKVPLGMPYIGHS